ncbi:MAG TPA: diguanylate cyclase [Kofleriaceae bacterium]|nr:diguanylate cyclase [Kofleriaceae bacterium]
MHGFIAQLIDVESESLPILREALAEAGCLDIDPAATVGGVLLERGEPQQQRRLVIISIHRGNIGGLQRLAGGSQPIQVLALCDEADIELAFGSGATQVVTRPLRRRELIGRIRESMRNRSETDRRESRERHMCDAIVALQKEKQDLERLVCVDALTGIANRRHAMELLANEWKRAARDHAPLALIMIDLDCFHAYNEQYGHLGGDACLQRAADAMVRCLRRPSDFLGRYGGEEFMAVLPNTDAVGAKIVAERLRAAVEGLRMPHAASTCSEVVTVTVGFASIRVLADDQMERLIAAADGALLQAKAHGRNAVGGIAPLVRPTRVSAQLWERYEPVYVDPWYADRVPAFLDTTKAQVSALADSVRNGERRSGLTMRRLRNSAHELGLTTIERLALNVEDALREGELVQLRTATEELLQYVMHVQIIYRRTEDAHAASSVA